MRVHHLNCATLRPPFAGRLHNNGARHIVCHCLLLEAAHGLVLIDTGLGELDVASPETRLGRGATAFLRPRRDPAQTARAQIRALGLDPDDVRDVVLTHLDLDHAGGLADFPEARAHVMMAEQEAAVLRSSMWEKQRYRGAQLDTWSRWSLYSARGEAWMGFPAVRELVGLDSEVLLIPLPGHSRGHAGVAVRSERGWLLHAGDAYFHREELAGRRPPRLLRWFEEWNGMNPRVAEATQARLVELARSPDVTVFCSHDPVEFDRLRSR